MDIGGSRKLNTSELMNALIYVLFAVIIIPIIASQIAAMTWENESAHQTEITLLNMLTIFIVLGIVYAVIKSLL